MSIAQQGHIHNTYAQTFHGLRSGIKLRQPSLTNQQRAARTTWGGDQTLYMYTIHMIKGLGLISSRLWLLYQVQLLPVSEVHVFDDISYPASPEPCEALLQRCSIFLDEA